MLRGWLWRVPRGQGGTGLPLHTPLSHRPPGTHLWGQRPQALGTTGSRLLSRLSHHLWVQGAEELGRLASARALPSPSQAQPSKGRTPSLLSARHSFQHELLAKRFEIPGRRLLGSGSPYLTGTQEPRQGRQEQQLGRRRRRRHPGPPQHCPQPSKPGSARRLALPPRTHAARVPT